MGSLGDSALAYYSKLVEDVGNASTVFLEDQFDSQSSATFEIAPHHCVG